MAASQQLRRRLGIIVIVVLYIAIYHIFLRIERGTLRPFFLLLFFLTLSESFRVLFVGAGSRFGHHRLRSLVSLVCRFKD